MAHVLPDPVAVQVVAPTEVQKEVLGVDRTVDLVPVLVLALALEPVWVQVQHSQQEPHRSIL